MLGSRLWIKTGLSKPRLQEEPLSSCHDSSVSRQDKLELYSSMPCCSAVSRQDTSTAAEVMRALLSFSGKREQWDSPHPRRRSTPISRRLLIE